MACPGTFSGQAFVGNSEAYHAATRYKEQMRTGLQAR